MKLNLFLNNKELITPNFDVHYNKEKTIFTIVITPKDNEEAILLNNDLNNKDTIIESQRTSILFSTLNKIYIFNFEENFNFLPRETPIKIGVAFTDEYNIIIKRKKYEKNINRN